MTATQFKHNLKQDRKYYIIPFPTANTEFIFYIDPVISKKSFYGIVW